MVKKLHFVEIIYEDTERLLCYQRFVALNRADVGKKVDAIGEMHEGKEFEG
jgi:hypothetical protein